MFPVLRNGKWSFIDRGGNAVVEPRYDMVEDFFDGLACVRTNVTMGVGHLCFGGRLGYIDATGKSVWGPAE